MKLSIAIASLFLATSTALPAFAAMPAPTSLRDYAAAPVESVQYRQSPRELATPAERHDGYRAYGYQNGTSNSRNARPHDVIPGWPCVESGDGEYTSAYPSWEVRPSCN